MFGSSLPLTPSTPRSTPFPNNPCTLFHTKSCCAAHGFLDVWLSLEHSQLTRCHPLKESRLFSPQPSVVSSSSARYGASWFLWVQMRCIQKTLITVVYCLCLLRLSVPAGQEAHAVHTYSCRPPPLWNFFSHRISQWDSRKFYTKTDTIQNRGLPRKVAVMVIFHCQLDRQSGITWKESCSVRVFRWGWPVGISVGYYPDYVNERTSEKWVELVGGFRS